jgi:hypothetical protein
VLVVTWILGGGLQPAATYQIPFESFDLCNQAVETIKADVARLEKERADEVKALMQGAKDPDLSRVLSAAHSREYALSAVCLVTSTAP